MIFTRQSDRLPSGVNGLIVHDENDDYTIFLNARQSYDGNKKTVAHEMEHITSGDFYSTDEADYIEWVRHKE